MKWEMTTNSWTLFFIAVAGLIGLALGIYWLFWSLWTWALPQIWPTGPAGFISPGYWLFVGCLFLLGFIGKTVFGGGKQ